MTIGVLIPVLIALLTLVTTQIHEDLQAGNNRRLIITLGGVGILAFLFFPGIIMSSTRREKIIRNTLDIAVLIAIIVIVTLTLYGTKHEIGAPTIAMLTAIYLVKKLKGENKTYVDRQLLDPIIYIGTFLTTATWLNGEMIKWYKPNMENLTHERNLGNHLPLMVGLWTEAILSITISIKAAQAIWKIREKYGEGIWARIAQWASTIFTIAVFLGLTANISPVLDSENIATDWWMKIWTSEWWLYTPMLGMALAIAIPIITIDRKQHKTPRDKSEPDC